MATLILSAVGTILGGPIGGAIGALVGHEIDTAIIGGKKVEGPRLKELSVQTSSYGAALPLHFGRMRAAGTVIWATELIEHSETRGGKGRPSVTNYAYSASFAVALASRPIAGIGRIWADGNLLRGAAGDLKTGGTLRIHTGFGDQLADPLLAQAEAAGLCPAYRHCAYAVFEDLQLADFGNRLPSLTFEILADPAGCTVGSILNAVLPEAIGEGLDTAFAGFSIDQGTVGDTLATISAAIPLSCATAGERLVLRMADASASASPPMLPGPASSQDTNADRAKVEGWSRRRESMPGVRQSGLRYYDIARDYQPGLQRSMGRSGQGDLAIIDLPAALTASTASSIANAVGRRATRAADTITYRVAEIDAAHVPGAIVRLPIADGLWRVEQWEWQKDGVLMELRACCGRSDPPVAASAGSDAGRINQSVDLGAVPTVLEAFELPWNGQGSGTTPIIYAAASAMSAGWSGASLFAEPGGNGGALIALGTTGRTRSIIGRTQGILPAASPLLLDRISALDVKLAASDLTLQDATLEQVLQGANRALVGAELIQFASATPKGGGIWRLSGLMRGRGGTEWAISSHKADEAFVFVDDALVTLDPAIVGDASTTRIVAAGLGDAVAVEAAIAQAGTTLRPLAPVHGRATRLGDGSVTLTWRRRARGAWNWPDAVDAPLNEESELYTVDFGNVASPSLRWQVTGPALQIPAAKVAGLATPSAPALFYVRQMGRGGMSMPLIITLSA
jgi:hypothetical protein